MRLVAATLALAAMVAGQGGTRSPDAAVELLRELIRLDTSNPPGHEAQIAEMLAAKFRPLGFVIDIIPTPEAGKSHFIALREVAGKWRNCRIAELQDCRREGIKGGRLQVLKVSGVEGCRVEGCRV